MRLIDGDHLEERVRKIIKDYAQAAKDVNVVPGRVTFSSCGVIGLVQSEPTENAVPVVRCKDCKFYYRMTAETGICQLGCPHLGNDGFCSEGERKDGNDD